MCREPNTENYSVSLQALVRLKSYLIARDPTNLIYLSAIQSASFSCSSWYRPDCRAEPEDLFDGRFQVFRLFFQQFHLIGEV